MVDHNEVPPEATEVVVYKGMNITFFGGNATMGLLTTQGGGLFGCSRGASRDDVLANARRKIDGLSPRDKATVARHARQEG